MTTQEKLIVTAYTGILMVNTDTLLAYASLLLNRELFVHELAYPEVKQKIKELSWPSFKALCES